MAAVTWQEGESGARGGAAPTVPSGASGLAAVGGAGPSEGASLPASAAASSEHGAAAQFLAKFNLSPDPPPLRPPTESPSAPTESPPPQAGGDASVECCVCLEGRKSHVFVPCGHVCVCQACADDIMATAKACPICRQVSTLCMRVFMCS